jgi:hypothetical protein
VLRTLLIARGEAPKLLAAIDEPLNLVALTVQGSIEWSCTAFVNLAGDGDPDPMLAGILPDLPAAVPFIPYDPARSMSGAATAEPLHRPARHQLREDHGFMALAGGSHQGEQLAMALSAEVDLRAKAALAAP